jgi:flagellar biosynthesis regulator FlaF
VNTIWIKMYDKSVRTLEIQHASEMKKNLISLSLFLFSKLWLFN